MRTVFAVLLTLALQALAQAPLALAVPEGDFGRAYEQEVAPFYKAGVTGEFKGVGGARIRYRVWEATNERAALVVVNGRTESFVKYAEVLSDLSREGFSLYVLDHRGQGLSDRLLKNPMIGYVDHFSDYVADLKTFVDTVVKARPHEHLYMLAHSMGGAIAALYNEQYPTDFERVALSAPMLQINTAPYPEWAASALANFNVGIGLGKHYAPGQGDHDSDSKWETNKLTHSQVRYAKAVQLSAAFPQTRLGGVSNRWVQQSLRATSQIRKGVKKVRAQVLLLQAGDDHLVKPDGQKFFCSHVASCRIVALPGAYHELLMERDSIRDRALAEIVGFLK